MFKKSVKTEFNNNQVLNMSAEREKNQSSSAEKG